jgi:DNA adenine methylase
VIDKVDGRRMANDIIPYLIAMWESIVNRGWVPKKITRELYCRVRDHSDHFDPGFVGWVGFNCSYSGKFFGGFAGDTKTKAGTIRDYQSEAIRNTVSQAEALKGTVFSNRSFYDLQIPPMSIVYCDPPYRGTTGYNKKFDHDLFWEWARALCRQGHSVYVSEYTAPIDFECVWYKDVGSCLSANGKSGGNKKSTEKLFILSRSEV